MQYTNSLWVALFAALLLQGATKYKVVTRVIRFPATAVLTTSGSTARRAGSIFLTRHK